MSFSGNIVDPTTGRNVAFIRKNGEAFRDDVGQAKIATVRDDVAVCDLDGKVCCYLAEIGPGATGSPAFEKLLASR